MIFLTVFALGGLVCCWVWGDASGRTKGALTAVYVATWGLLLIPYHSLYLFPIAQCLFAVVVWGMTFGVDWLMRNAWHIR
jgi:hypothetical protein